MVLGKEICRENARCIKVQFLSSHYYLLAMNFAMPFKLVETLIQGAGVF